MQTESYRSNADDYTAAVASIRTAQALNERLGVLVRARETYDDERLSLELGEARQLYPTIWTHLDDARNELVRRGVPVVQYDGIRANDVIDAGAILGVEVAADRVGLAFTGGVAKTAHLNTQGHTLATHAANALRAALPSVDWEALERADAEQLAAFGSLGPPLWKKVLFYAIAGVLVAAAVAMFVFYKLGR